MKRTICTLLIALLLLGAFAGCGNSNENAPTTAIPDTTVAIGTTAAAETTTEAAETTTEAAETTTEAAETTTEAAETTTEAAETTTEAAAPETTVDAGEAAALLEGLAIEDAAIVIDGVLYKSEDPYSHFVENGWDFDFADYNVDESYVLNKDQTIISTIRLHNIEKYGTSYSNPSITIGFINTSDGAKPLKECAVHGIEVDGTTGFRRFEDSEYNASACYSFSIIKGLSRGASMDAVKAAWGEPDDVYVGDGSDYHYELLTYEGDHVTYKLKVFTNPEIGLQGVAISDSRNWKR